MLKDLLELAAVGLVIVGVGLLSVPAALIVAGVAGVYATEVR